MPAFKFTSPDGKQYTVNGPDGATKEQAFAILQQQIAGAPKGPTAADIPGGGEAGNRNVGKPDENTDNLLGKAFGLVEPAIALGTGAVGGLVGSIAGVGKTLVSGKYGTQAGVREGEDFAGKVADAMTYQPRTQTGGKLSQLAGQAIADSGVVGIPIPELNALGRAASSTTGAVRTLATATNAPMNAADAAAAAAAKGAKLSDLVRAPNTMAGVGAADTSAAAQRAARAASMPVPMKLTKGMLTKDFDQVQFERETAKAKEGKPLQDRYAELNQQMGQNLDAFADQTGGEASSLRAVGKSVTDVVDAKKAMKKQTARDLYNQADAAGETAEMVDVSPLVDWIEKNKGKDKLAPIISTIETELKQNAKTVGGGSDPLTLTQRPKQTMMTLGASEDLRQAINKLAEPGTPNLVFGKEAQKLIDAATEDKGGPLYKQARRAWENYKSEFDDRDVIDKLTRYKPGTKDRSVAYEDVMKHTLLNGSLDDVRHVFRVLEAFPEGADPALVEAGQQAAKDLRGALVNHMKEQVFSNTGADTLGNAVGSPAKFNRLINELDKDGKLERIFGKQNAQQLRDARDLATDIYTSPAGSVNSSNTASALIKALDTAAGYTQGVPIVGKAVRFGLQQVKSKRTMNQVKEALNPNLSDLSGKGK